MNKYIMVALAPWFSLPSIFIIIALGAGLIIKNKQKYLRTALLFTAIGCASFSFEWLLVLHRSLAIKDFIFLKYDSLGGWLWNFKQVFFAYTGPNINLVLIVGIFSAMILLLLGISEARRRHGLSYVALLLLPLLLSFGASFVKVYPLFGRCLLFSTPGIYLLIGYGMNRILRSSSQSVINSFVILVLLIFPCLTETLHSYRKPTGGVREALQFIADRRQNGDVVLCDFYSAPSIVYYRLIGRPSATVLEFALEPEKQIEGNVIYDDLPYHLCSTTYSRQRVWLVSETIFYARGTRATKSFQRYLVKNFHLQRNEDNILDYWKNILHNLSAKRQVIHQYITNRVLVYGFDKQSIPKGDFFPGGTKLDPFYSPNKFNR
jgi:hypothetical protein